MLSESTIAEFLEQLGSSQPVPGGGGAAALSGAQAASLVTMVARLTAGKAAFAAIEGRIREIIVEGDRRRQELIQAIDQDAAAFEAVIQAYALPHTTAEEKAVRAASLQPALKGATESPLNIARHCVALVGLAAELAESSNPQTISDAGTAAVLAEAALSGAILQARINLKAIKDTQYVEHSRGEIALLLMVARDSRTRAMAAVEDRLES